MKFIIRWRTRDKKAINAIMGRFKMPNYITINGWSPAEIESQDTELFKECERRGFFSIIPGKWCKNGEVFSFIT